MVPQTQQVGKCLGWRDGAREGAKDRGRNGGREGARDRGRNGGRDGGREGGRKGDEGNPIVAWALHFSALS